MKSILKGITLLLTVSALFLTSCEGKKNKSEATSAEENKVAINTSFPQLNADSAFLFTKAQLEFGPRVPGTVAHEKCASYLEKTMRKYAPTVIVQNFEMKAWNDKMMKGKNIIASFNPESNNRIFLSAHWDSRFVADHDPNPANHNKPIDGANDGASGVGVLLEVTRILKLQNPAIGVDIILFDLEDQGEPQGTDAEGRDNWCLGSQFWAQNFHKLGYQAKYGILLDMVGAKNPYFTMEQTSMYYAPDIMKKVWNIAAKIGYESYFSTQQTSGIIDDHLYINQKAKIPTIDIIHWDATTESHFYPYWHTVEDNLSKIDLKTLEIVGKTLLTVIYNEK